MQTTATQRSRSHEGHQDQPPRDPPHPEINRPRSITIIFVFMLQDLDASRDEADGYYDDDEDDFAEPQKHFTYETMRRAIAISHCSAQFRETAEKWCAPLWHLVAKANSRFFLFPPSRRFLGSSGGASAFSWVIRNLVRFGIPFLKKRIARLEERVELAYAAVQQWKDQRDHEERHNAFVKVSNEVSDDQYDVVRACADAREPPDSVFFKVMNRLNPLRTHTGKKYERMPMSSSKARELVVRRLEDDGCDGDAWRFAAYSVQLMTRPIVLNVCGVQCSNCHLECIQAAFCYLQPNSSSLAAALAAAIPLLNSGEEILIGGQKVTARQVSLLMIESGNADGWANLVKEPAWEDEEIVVKNRTFIRKAGDAFFSLK